MAVVVGDAFRGKAARFFSQNIDELQRELQAYLRVVGEQLRVANAIPEYHHDLTSGGTQEVFVYGRIYASYQEDDPAERGLLKAAEIQFVPEFYIPRLHLDIQPDIIPGIFRGQIIAARGIVDAHAFHATKLFTDTRSEPPEPLPPDFSGQIIFATGPYVTTDFERLRTLNAALRPYRGATIVLFGPFAPCDSEILMRVDTDWTARELMHEVIALLTDGIDQTNVIVIPSIDDALAMPFMPHPELPTMSRVQSKGDPCFISIGSTLRILATAFDIQFSVAGHYDGPTRTKTQEIVRQIAHQNSACPAMDPAVQVRYIAALAPPWCPHLIVSPTKLAGQIADVDGTKVVFLEKPRKLDKLHPFALVDIRSGQLTVNTRLTGSE